MTASPKTVREVMRTAVRLIAENVANKLLVGAAMDEHGISKDDVEAWNDIYDGVLGMIGTALKPLTQPAEQPQDGGLPPVARVWMYGTDEHSSEHAYTTLEAAQTEAIWEFDATLAEYPEYWSWEPCPPQNGRLAMLCGDDRTGYTVYPVTVVGQPQDGGPDDSFAMVAEGAPAGPARNVANHWHSYAAAIAPGAKSPEWTAIAQVTAAILGAMDMEQAERDLCGAQLAADSAQRLGASSDTTCVRPAGHAAHDDGNGVLWISGPRAEQDERDGDVRAVALLATVSGVCTCSKCEVFGRSVYRMVGKCWNCNAEPILMLFRAGDKTFALDCPFCGCKEVRSSRRATDDEIPAAAEHAAIDARDAKAPVKRTPEQWCEQYGVDIADPDGWRHTDAPAWDEPITLADFYERARESTVRLVGSVDWKRIARDAEGGDQ